MTGHWEMMGVLTTKPFQTFTDTGFPAILIDELEKKPATRSLAITPVAAPRSSRSWAKSR
jgi:phosphopentomutase